MFIPKAFGIIFLKQSLDKLFERKMPEKIQLQFVCCKLGIVLQTGYDYNAICVYMSVCMAICVSVIL